MGKKLLVHTFGTCTSVHIIKWKTSGTFRKLKDIRQWNIKETHTDRVMTSFGLHTCCEVEEADGTAAVEGDAIRRDAQRLKHVTRAVNALK